MRHANNRPPIRPPFCRSARGGSLYRYSRSSLQAGYRESIAERAKARKLPPLDRVMLGRPKAGPIIHDFFLRMPGRGCPAQGPGMTNEIAPGLALLRHSRGCRRQSPGVHVFLRWRQSRGCPGSAQGAAPGMTRMWWSLGPPHSRQFTRCLAMKSRSTLTPMPGVSGIATVPSAASANGAWAMPRVRWLWLTLNSRYRARGNVAMSCRL